ncbi:MAG: aspartate dehydrogenase [Candidatus Puniceispirillaceae bacterium]
MLSVGIIGLGTIGNVVAKALDDGIGGMRLAAIASGRRDKAIASIAKLSEQVDFLTIDEVVERCDIIVDCAPKAVFRDIAMAALSRGRTLVTVARQNGGQLVLATGALLGLDAVRAAAEGTIHSVRMITRKPPNALRDAPHIIDNNISLDRLNGAIRVFEGSAREGAKAFPANVNVAAALGLAGIGADATQLEVWADPHLDRNTHSIEVDADSAKFTLQIENVQSESNPGTGKITALSVIACLRGMTAPMKVGS